MRRIATTVLMALSLPAGPALAYSTPPPPVHARYGPLVQCLGGYAVAVGPSEAILVMDGGISLKSSEFLIHFSISPDPYREQYRSGEFEDPRLGRIVRYERGDADARRVENRLPLIDGEPSVIIRSSAAEEQTGLARVRPASAERSECSNFIAPDFPGEHPDASSWTATLIPGPLYRCERRVGYELNAGEAMREPWPSSADYTPSRVVIGEAHLSVHGPYRAPFGFDSPIAAGYEISARTDWSGSYLRLSPPRRLLRRLPRDTRYDYDLRIKFAPGGEAAARKFATRLEFVESGDPRCNVDQERP